MQFNASQISSLINGKVEGDAGIIVNSFGKIEEAQKGQLTFLANPKYEDFLYTTDASLIIVNESLELKQPVSATLIRVKDAYSAFAQLLTFYQEM
ncbi:MAG: LpxD N-terminal domain-containing protein, partial [Chitinophagaceae bacterium]